MIDLVAMKAHFYKPDGDGKATIEEIPAALADDAKEAHEKLVEMVAEGDDALMEEFFHEGTLPLPDLIPGLRARHRGRKNFPGADDRGAAQHRQRQPADVYRRCISRIPTSIRQVGLQRTGRQRATPSPRKFDDAQPLSVFVFKTLADPFAGRINYFKVMSGVLKNDATLMNYNRNMPERFQHTQVVQGKLLTEVQELHAGDIGAIAKLKETSTGETLGDKSTPDLL